MQIGGGYTRMMGPRLEQAVSAVIMRARFYERIAHDAGPWLAVLYGPAFTRVPLERYVRPDRVVLIGYLREPGIRAVAIEIWCGDDMMISSPLDPPVQSPARVGITLRVEEEERVA
jgi:hypothetical protein